MKNDPICRRFCLLALLLAGASAHAETLTGIPTIVDADTLKIEGVTIRLEGIDAPESRQQCEDAGGGGIRLRRGSDGLAESGDWSQRSDVRRFGARQVWPADRFLHHPEPGRGHY